MIETSKYQPITIIVPYTPRHDKREKKRCLNHSLPLSWRLATNARASVRTRGGSPALPNNSPGYTIVIYFEFCLLARPGSPEPAVNTKNTAGRTKYKQLGIVLTEGSKYSTDVLDSSFSNSPPRSVLRVPPKQQCRHNNSAAFFSWRGHSNSVSSSSSSSSAETRRTFVQSLARSFSTAPAPILPRAQYTLQNTRTTIDERLYFYPSAGQLL